MKHGYKKSDRNASGSNCNDRSDRVAAVLPPAAARFRFRRLG